MEVKKCLHDVKNLAQGLKEYFSLKNQLLWSGSAVATGTTITAPNIGKYQTIKVKFGLGSQATTLVRDGAYFKSGTIVGYPAWFAIQDVTLKVVDDNTVEIASNYMQDVTNNIIKNDNYGITAITGLEPLVPESLLAILGGGYYFLTKGGAVHAKC